MPPVGFEPTISAGERPQTHAAATGTGTLYRYVNQLNIIIIIIIINYEKK